MSQNRLVPLSLVIMAVYATSNCKAPEASKRLGETNCPKPATANEKLAIVAVTSYSAEIEPILKSSCTSCHFTGGRKPFLDTYLSAKAGYAKSLSEINLKKMPPSAQKLSAADVAKFQSWSAGGFLENGGNVQPSPNPSIPTTGAVTYEADIKPLIASRCLKCHATTSRPILASFKEVSAAASQVYDSMNSGRMPKFSSKLPLEEISLFKKWMDSGMQERVTVPVTPTSTPSTFPESKNNSSDATDC